MIIDDNYWVRYASRILNALRLGARRVGGRLVLGRWRRDRHTRAMGEYSLPTLLWRHSLALGGHVSVQTWRGAVCSPTAAPSSAASRVHGTGSSVPVTRYRQSRRNQTATSVWSESAE